jgi:molybdenum cofactor cytidylyltransferase
VSSAVVPAAGAAKRFGGDKLVALIDGVPLIDRTLGCLLDAGVTEIVVVLPPAAAWTLHAARLRDPAVRVVENPDPSRGMFSSIQIGLGAATGRPVAVLPGDMPFVQSATVRALFDYAKDERGLVSPRLNGRRGHPVILPADVREAVLAADPRGPLNEVLKPFAARFVNVDVADQGAVRDVDVVEDVP